MAAHSALGPSGAHRWKACAGSVNAERLFRLANPASDTSSPYAEEGTRAHELAERLLLNPDLPHPGDDIDTMDDVDMLRHCLRYRDYCLAQTTNDSIDLVEQRVRMPAIHKDCFGTVDFATFDPHYKHAHIIDLKYGQGQFVEVHENPQAMMYAEGFRQWLYDEHGHKARHFTVHIFQPRARDGENIGSYQFSNGRLNDFVHETHLQALETETEIDKFNPGDKQCQWCLANPCQARQQQMHELIAADFEDIDDAIIEITENSPLMDDEQIAGWLSKAKSLKAFIARVEALAYQRAMSEHKIPGFKLVQGRGTYRPTNIPAMEFILGDAVYKTPEVRSQSDLKKHVGTNAFKAVADFYKRIPGKPTLVADSDPRSAWNIDDDIDKELSDL